MTMPLRFQSQIAAFAQGVACGKCAPHAAHELARIFTRYERAGRSIVAAHEEAVEQRLLPPMRQGVTPE